MTINNYLITDEEGKSIAVISGPIGQQLLRLVEKALKDHLAIDGSVEVVRITVNDNLYTQTAIAMAQQDGDDYVEHVLTLMPITIYTSSDLK